jgi:DNA-binding NtrC family response regulator
MKTFISAGSLEANRTFRETNRQYEAGAGGPAGFLLGESPAIARVRAIVRQVAPSSLAVLIEGPTGSGKELVARAVHVTSARRGRIVPFNVCAIAEGMFEDALFGHVRGAFTGAVADAPGFLLEADCGTIFFDEISGLPLGSQAKLLRAIETKEFRPVGGRVDRRSEFRVVSATNESLCVAAADRRFREDLLFRLRGVLIEIPALGDRREDIPILARHFLSETQSSVGHAVALAEDAIELLCARDWPGNVRELRQVLESAAALSTKELITRAELVRCGALRHASPATWLMKRDSFATRRLLQLLEDVEWNIDVAAARLGVHRATVYRRLARIGETPRRSETGRIARPAPARIA